MRYFYIIILVFINLEVRAQENLYILVDTVYSEIKDYSGDHLIRKKQIVKQAQSEELQDLYLFYYSANNTLRGISFVSINNIEEVLTVKEFLQSHNPVTLCELADSLRGRPLNEHEIFIFKKFQKIYIAEPLPQQKMRLTKVRLNTPLHSNKSPAISSEDRLKWLQRELHP